MRANVFIGFPLGGLLSLAIAAATTLVLPPARHRGRRAWAQVGAARGGSRSARSASCSSSSAFFAATFGAALETGLSAGYTVAQYFGWQWGKFVEPRDAARFHVVVLLACVAGTGILLTTSTRSSSPSTRSCSSAVALPLTYLPILVVANDRDYMGESRQRPAANALGSFYLVVVLVASLAAIPLMVMTKAGQ